jgi:hypothetical protein
VEAKVEAMLTTVVEGTPLKFRQPDGSKKKKTILGVGKGVWF